MHPAAVVFFIFASGEERMDRAAWESDGLPNQVSRILPLLSRRDGLRSSPPGTTQRGDFFRNF
jgi:hypothetical protein